MNKYHATVNGKIVTEKNRFDEDCIVYLWANGFDQAREKFEKKLGHKNFTVIFG